MRIRSTIWARARFELELQRQLDVVRVQVVYIIIEDVVESREDTLLWDGDWSWERFGHMRHPQPRMTGTKPN